MKKGLRAQQGLSLVELLISTAIGMIADLVTVSGAQFFTGVRSCQALWEGGGTPYHSFNLQRGPVERLLRRPLAGLIYMGARTTFGRYYSREWADSDLLVTATFGQPGGRDDVIIDKAAAYRLAVEELTSAGYSCVGLIDYQPNDADICAKLCRSKGADFVAFEMDMNWPFHRDGDIWDTLHDQFEAWLLALPGPVGIVTVSSHDASFLMSVCEEFRIAVPDEIGFVCTAPPSAATLHGELPLTTLELPYQEAGFEAARVLANIMQSGRRGPQTVLQPTGIRRSLSSQPIPTTNKKAIEAIRIIRAEASSGLNVNELAGRLGMSRNALTRLIKTHTGRLPSKVIQTIRFDMACSMLAETTVSVTDISTDCGFGSLQHFTRAFRQRFGVSPARFRNSKAQPQRSAAVPS